MSFRPRRTGLARALVPVGAAIVLGAVSLLGSACTTDDPDIIGLQSTLATRLEERIGELPELDCSAASAAEPDESFQCEAVLGELRFPVDIEAYETREQAIATVQARLVNASTVVDLVGERLSAELGETTIDCGGPVVRADENGVIDACTATDSSGIVRELELSLSTDGAIKVELGRS